MWQYKNISIHKNINVNNRVPFVKHVHSLEFQVEPVDKKVPSVN